jgi:hypothetical protein
MSVRLLTTPWFTKNFAGGVDTERSPLDRGPGRTGRMVPQWVGRDGVESHVASPWSNVRTCTDQAG